MLTKQAIYIKNAALVFCLPCSLLFAFPLQLAAQDSISTDILVDNAPGQPIGSHVVAQFTGANTTASITDLGLPPASDIAALHVIDETTLLFTLKSTTQLNSLTAKTGDVLRWKNDTFELVVSGADLGLGPATGIDALTVENDALIFSTNIADTVNGSVVTDSDLLTWSEQAGTAVLLGQSVCGIPPETDLAGVHLMDTGQFLMAFSNAAEVGGVSLHKGDIARCNPDNGAVVLQRRFADIGPEWAAVGVDAVSRFLSERIFIDSFESLNP